MHLRSAIAVLLVSLVSSGCGREVPVPPSDVSPLPTEPAASALHCYLLLTLTIDQMAEIDGPGRQGGFVARRGTDELLRARARVAAQLDGDLLDELVRDPWPRLEELLAGFDTDGDGQLATAAEVDEFNRHVVACTLRDSGAGS